MSERTPALPSRELFLGKPHPVEVVANNVLVSRMALEAQAVELASSDRFAKSWASIRALLLALGLLLEADLREGLLLAAFCLSLRSASCVDEAVTRLQGDVPMGKAVSVAGGLPAATGQHRRAHQPTDRHRRVGNVWRVPFHMLRQVVDI